LQERDWAVPTERDGGGLVHSPNAQRTAKAAGRQTTPELGVITAPAGPKGLEQWRSMTRDCTRAGGRLAPAPSQDLLYGGVAQAGALDHLLASPDNFRRLATMFGLCQNSRPSRFPRATGATASMLKPLWRRRSGRPYTSWRSRRPSGQTCWPCIACARLPAQPRDWMPEWIEEAFPLVSLDSRGFHSGQELVLHVSGWIH
jgi:hypothetical protein